MTSGTRSCALSLTRRASRSRSTSRCGRSSGATPGPSPKAARSGRSSTRRRATRSSGGGFVSCEGAAWRPSVLRPPAAIPSEERRMKLCQFQVAGGARRVGVVDGDAVIDITAPRAGVSSVLDLVVKGRTLAGIERLARQLARAPRRPRHAWAALDRAPRGGGAGLLAPLDPPEVWGAGITYRRSREYYSEHDTGQAHRGKGIYDYVYEAERPELFYKGSAARSVGPHGAVGLRGDSKLTVVEA